MTFGRQATTAYRRESVQAAEYADPHSLVSMLLDGAIERVAQARGALQRGGIASKGERIGKAMAIIDSLLASLDLDRGGEVAANLASLYDYMMRRLLHANLSNDVAALDEVQRLLREIRAGWTGIIPSAETAQ